MPDRMLEDMPNRMPEGMPDRMLEDMPNRMPEDMPDRMPEDLPVTTCINVMVGITRSKVIRIFGGGYTVNPAEYPGALAESSTPWRARRLGDLMNFGWAGNGWKVIMRHWLVVHLPL